MSSADLVYRIITAAHEYGITADGRIEELDDELPASAHLPLIVAMRTVERRMAAVFRQNATAREVAERIAEIRLATAA